MSVPVAVDYRRCPDHPDAELVPIPNCYAGGISCTGKVQVEDTEFTCGARICGRCSGKGADWSSGLCPGCYRIVRRDRDEWQSIERRHYAQRGLLSDLIDEADLIVKQWLMNRLVRFDADWQAVIEERFS